MVEIFRSILQTECMVTLMHTGCPTVSVVEQCEAKSIDLSGEKDGSSALAWWLQKGCRGKTVFGSRF